MPLSLAKVTRRPRRTLPLGLLGATRDLKAQFSKLKARRQFARWCRTNIGQNFASKQEFGSNPIALFEVNTMASAHIAYAFLADALVAKHGCEIVGYAPRSAGSRKLKWVHRISWPNRVYRAFGARRMLRPEITVEMKRRSHTWAEHAVSQLSQKSDLVALEVSGVQIGDLVYDGYLNSTGSPTVDFGDEAFVHFLGESVALFWAWEAIFNKYEVVAVSVSHCVYRLAIPLRIAISRDVEAFQVNATHAYRLSHAQKFAYADFHDYKAEFERLSPEAQSAALSEAEKRLELRLGGAVGVDMPYSTMSAYSSPASSQRALNETHATKVLIATHCFFDSPHPFGETLFPDFYEWLSFLGELSNQLDYEFYLKVHPDFRSDSKKVVDSFVERYPRFHAIDPRVSHHQLISEGISAALTVHGTIGHEYAWLGLPVINASRNNPHIAFSFNVHPSTVEEYEGAVRGLRELNPDLNRKSIAAYYYMHYLRQSENLVFSDYDALLSQIGGYRAQFDPRVYGVWLRGELERAEKLRQAFRKFVLADRYRLETHPA